MNLLIAIFRSIVLIVFTLVCLPVQWLAFHFSWNIKNVIPNFYHRHVAKIMGITIDEKGEISHQTPKLILSNHVSWLDIVIISATHPVAFVAKSEVSKWPLIGLFAQLQQTIFINRTRRSETKAVSEEIKNRIQNHQSIVLFAEGTTSDGNRTLPFKSALLGALEAQDEHILVQPLAINYTKMGGLPIGRAQRPTIAWYGDMEIASHLWALLKVPSIHVELSWCKPLQFEENDNRKALTQMAERQVRIALHKSAQIEQ